MEPSNGTVWNDNVQIGKWREIAARGITPNHRYGRIRIGDIEGELWDYEHFDKTTVLTVRIDGRFVPDEFDLKHLDTIQFA